MSPFAAAFDREGGAIDTATAEALRLALGGVGEGRLRASSGASWVLLADADAPTDGTLGAQHLDTGPLRRALGAEAQELSVGQLLGRGSEVYGSDLWRRLEGSLALAWVDPRAKVLHLVRDLVGEHSLFFSEVGSLVVAADRIEVLLRFGATTPSLDASQLVRHFGFESPRPGRTCFAGIDEVEPGTWLRFGSSGRTAVRFDFPQTEPLGASGSDAELAEEFRVRLAGATARFLRDPARVGVMLSGGLDSTSLAILAARHAEDFHGTVAACSWTFDELVACDERPGIESTLALHDFEAIQVSGDECWPLSDLDLFSNLPGFPEENPYRALKSRLYRAAGDRGRTLLLNGGPAEIFYRGGGLYLRDLLRAGRWATAARGLARQIRGSGWRAGAGSVARVVRPTGRRRARRPPPEWLNENTRRLWLQEMETAPQIKRGTRDVVPYLALESRGFAIENQYAARQGIRVGSPYWTREWVDFMLDLPAHQAYRPGVTKFIAREAMRGLIPEQIRQQQAPTLLDPLFDRGLFDRETDTVADLLAGSDTIWREFVDPSAVIGLGPESPPERKLLLWQCLSLELWRRKHGWSLG